MFETLDLLDVELCIRDGDFRGAIEALDRLPMRIGSRAELLLRTQAIALQSLGVPARSFLGLVVEDVQHWQDRTGGRVPIHLMNSFATGEATAAHFAAHGHFGGAGTFLWVDPALDVACAALTDRPFGEWANAAWPPFSDQVRAAYGGELARAQLS